LEPLSAPRDAADAETVLEAEGIERVHVGIFDLDAAFREQRLPLDQVRAALAGRYSFCNVLHKWDTGESVFADPPFVDEDVHIDPASLRRYPFEPDSALFVADYAGPSRGLSPREVLKAQLARADDMGFAVRAALEFEFIVLDESAQSLRDKGYEDLQPFAPDNRCWSGMTAATNADFVADLEDMARTLGIPLYRLGMELGPGCFEATLAARDALAAADDAALFKVYTKAFCRQRDLTASFMAQLSTDFPGLSGHVHLSLADKQSGRPLFHDPGDPLGMSRQMRGFVGGLVGLLPDGLALCSHTVNAYRRMVPGNWSPRTPTWGVRNYTTAVRVMSSAPETARIEFRVPAADTNPFLAMALALGAGLGGIEGGTAPPPPIEGDAREVVPEGLEPLPRNLLEASERLAASAQARACFSDTFIDYFVASRRREIEIADRHVSAFERARYIEVV
jgi:glutamine synthetase